MTKKPRPAFTGRGSSFPFDAFAKRRSAWSKLAVPLALLKKHRQGKTLGFRLRIIAEGTEELVPGGNFFPLGKCLLICNNPRRDLGNEAVNFFRGKKTALPDVLRDGAGPATLPRCPCSPSATGHQCRSTGAWPGPGRLAPFVVPAPAHECGLTFSPTSQEPGEDCPWRLLGKDSGRKRRTYRLM